MNSFQREILKAIAQLSSVRYLISNIREVWVSRPALGSREAFPTGEIYEL